MSVLVYVVCDIRAHGNLWMVIIVVSNLAMFMFCCVCDVHEHVSQSLSLRQKLVHTSITTITTIHKLPYARA